MAKFTDHYTRWKEVYLIRTKHEAMTTISSRIWRFQSGIRVETLWSDNYAENIADVIQVCWLFPETGIVQALTATNTSQQNGVSERDGHVDRLNPVGVYFWNQYYRRRYGTSCFLQQRTCPTDHSCRFWTGITALKITSSPNRRKRQRFHQT